MPERPEWWRHTVCYQIYPRSFADGNGDGVGDLIGVTERLDHLAALGIDSIWLSPFFRSPMADGGYDVADPCDVDPMFGTLADFDTMLAAAHERGIRVTVDIVPNHFSDQHPWFVEALASPPGSAARERFIFREGRGPDGAEPPNNWPSAFGGPAWTRVPDGQWYLRIFAQGQPDLNWENPDVTAEFERITRFWLDRGVDGFRMDVAHGMAKPPELLDIDQSEWTTGPGAHMPGDLRFDNDGVHEHLRMFRRVLDEYPGDRMVVGEVWVPDPERLARYARPDELNLVFDFALLLASFGAESYRAAIDEAIERAAAVHGPCTWVLSNHDVDRHPTRYGGGALGVRRARAAALLQLALPGAAYLYNGDELALENAFVPDWALQDPTWEQSGHTDRGRDGERVPLPWSGDAPPFGFTTGPTTWLPMPAEWAPVTVAAQAADPSSTLSLYRAALALRRSEPLFVEDEFAWIDAPDDTLAFRRGTSFACVLNTGPSPAPLPAGEVLLASVPLEDGLLPADAAVWLRT